MTERIAAPSRTITLSLTLPSPAYCLELLRAGPGAAWTLLSEWQRRAASRHQLRHLDPRLRQDMGLTAAQVAEEVAKPFWVA